MRILKRVNIPMVLITLVFGGCSNPSYFKSLDNTILSPAYWNGAADAQQTTAHRLRIERSLSENRLEEAQKQIIETRRQNITETSLADLYSEVITRLYVLAEEQKTSGYPEKAGRVLFLAKEIYPSEDQTIELSLADIEKNIQDCADNLMKKGLIAYRAGELGRAITIWSGIESFLPNHTPSRIAQDTARQQLKSLQELSSTGNSM
jgi:hypothetical protein